MIILRNKLFSSDGWEDRGDYYDEDEYGNDDNYNSDNQTEESSGNTEKTNNTKKTLIAGGTGAIGSGIVGAGYLANKGSKARTAKKDYKAAGENVLKHQNMLDIAENKQLAELGLNTAKHDRTKAGGKLFRAKRNLVKAKKTAKNIAKIGTGLSVLAAGGKLIYDKINKKGEFDEQNNYRYN